MVVAVVVVASVVVASVVVASVVVAVASVVVMTSSVMVTGVVSVQAWARLQEQVVSGAKIPDPYAKINWFGTVIFIV